MIGPPPRTIAVVGGGFTGALLALKLAKARPQDRIRLIERDRRAGPGLAYGACAPSHLLNVPVSRMEVGLEPRFAEWLSASGEDLAEALEESGGALADAFVPRAAFGRYLEARLQEALSPDAAHGLRRIRGEAMRLCDAPRRGVVLEDGRVVDADLVFLCTGNAPPGHLAIDDPQGLLDGPLHVPDPWSVDAFAGLDCAAPVLLVGTGLTMVDVALALAERGHVGPVTAVSRHGWTPARHQSGGAWRPFLAEAQPASALGALRVLRAELRRAETAGTPWQRVFDAARPDVARVWRGWDLPARRAFLRHLRSRWDMHRHRMAPRVADRLHALITEGRLRVLAGRPVALAPAEGGASVHVVLRRGDEEVIGPVARVVNCTGPQSDLARTETPLLADLRRRGLLRADELRLGVETLRYAAVGADGDASSWLYAVGGLTRPSLWEITAVPEINAQVDALVGRLCAPGGPADAPLDFVFAELGAGI